MGESFSGKAWVFCLSLICIQTIKVAFPKVFFYRTLLEKKMFFFWEAEATLG